MIRIHYLWSAAFAVAASTLFGAPPPQPAAPPSAPRLRARLSIEPAFARVFSGALARFHVATGGIAPADVGWSVIGPGVIDRNGDYVADGAADQRAFIVAGARGLAAAAALTIVGPPSPNARLALVSCYDDGSIDVRDAAAATPVGTAATSGAAAGIAADRKRRIAIVADGDRLATFDARTTLLAYSSPVEGARFSEVALLADGYAATTDNNALAHRPGVRIYHIGGDRTPVLTGSAAAGETPEGIAVSGDGRTFFVTNVNTDSVMRFAFDGAGSARLTGKADTGHRPFGVAVDDRRRLLFVADNDTPTISGTASRPGLEVFSLPAMRRVARLVTGGQNALPLGVAVDATANRAFVTNEGEGTVVAYSVSPLRKLATLQAGSTPWTPALDAAGARLYVPSAMNDAFSVFDVASLRPIARAVPTCGYPTTIAIL